MTPNNSEECWDFPDLVGITGKKRSGKDTLADFLGYINYVKRGFADPLKEAAVHIFGLPIRAFDGKNKDREKVNEFWGMSPREMLQKLGTEACRDGICPDIWIKRMELELLRNDRVVIPDVRFENEAEFIRENGGFLIHVIRPDSWYVKAGKKLGLIREDNHRSEVPVKFVEGLDEKIVNDKSLAELERALWGVVTKRMRRISQVTEGTGDRSY